MIQKLAGRLELGSVSIERGIEPARRLFRGLLPSGLYGLAARAHDALACIRRMGYAEAMRLRSLLPSHRPVVDGGVATFRIPGLLHPISVRPGTTDPGEVIHSVIREAYGQYLPPPPIRFIIDAGANIGDTSAWYLSRFPEAKVYALEPEPENFQMLTRNCRPYGDRAILRQVALWPRKARLKIVPASVQSGFSIDESAVESLADVTAISPEDILAETSEETIDIFKCDIEGAELQLFSSQCDGWLARTRSLIIEIHGSAARDAVLAAVGRHRFTQRVFRDVYVFQRSV